MGFVAVFEISTLSVPNFDVAFGFTEDVWRFSCLRDEFCCKNTKMGHLRGCKVKECLW